ncbi:MAG: response regulator transcription factor [Synergistaceae bacterium]|nr:response regulator transcription factor [Synergistaceae bacterium]
MAAAIFRDRTDWKRSNDALRRCQEDLSALAASRAGKAENAGDEGPTIRLLLADSHDLFVEGVRALLRRTPGLELVGQARDAIEAAEQVLPQIRVDVALIDLSSPLQSGLEALRQLHERFPDVRMLVLSMRGDRDFVAGGLRAGALGYVLKECASEELCRAIRTVAEGQYAIAPSLLPPLVEGYLAAPVSDSEAESGRPPLSERESEVLRLLAGGLSSKQIALQLSISKNTVDTHRRRIFGKVGCNNMVELARWALRNGYL